MVHWYVNTASLLEKAKVSGVLRVAADMGALNVPEMGNGQRCRVVLTLMGRLVTPRLCHHHSP